MPRLPRAGPGEVGWATPPPGLLRPRQGASGQCSGLQSSLRASEQHPRTSDHDLQASLVPCPLSRPWA